MNRFATWAGVVCLTVGTPLFGASKSSKPSKSPCDTLVLAGQVITMDAQSRVLANGAVAITKGKIVGVGTAAEMKAQFLPRKTIDRHLQAVLPGLVNTHTHAAMNLFRGIADDRALMDWLQNYIFPAEAKNVSPAFVKAGTSLACLEMIRTGTTTFVDMYYYESDVAEATEKAGMRAVLGETWIDFPVPGHANLEETKKVTRAFIERWKNHPRIVPAIAPHAPYTCSKEVLTEAKKMADEFSVPLIIHVSETKDEQKAINEKYQNSPIRWLDSIGFLGPNVLVAHGVWLDSEDLKIMASKKVTLAHNPESNMKLASGIAPIDAARKAGIVVGLGTDGVAGSNNDLDMFEVMDFSGKLAKVGMLDPTVLPAKDLLRMATIDGARAAGLGEKTGSLEVGKAADLIAVDMEGPGVQPVYDVVTSLVYSAKASDVTLTMVDGRMLWDGQKVSTLDEKAIVSEAKKWRAKITAQLAPPVKGMEAPK